MPSSRYTAGISGAAEGEQTRLYSVSEALTAKILLKQNGIFLVEPCLGERGAEVCTKRCDWHTAQSLEVLKRCVWQCASVRADAGVPLLA